MKIALVNDIHVGKPLERNQIMRAASHLIDGILPQLLDHIMTSHSPDLIINLGDLIRSESREADLARYRQTITHFNRVSCPVIHLIGNHDIKQMSSQEVENIWAEAGFNQHSHGIQMVGNTALIWLGLECNRANQLKHKLPDDQLAWLDKTLQQIKSPVIIFTHCAIDDHNVDGNFFYEGYEAKNRNGFFYENYAALQKIISKCKSVEAVIQAHLHYFHTKIIEDIPYITCPAMGDNICGPNITNHIPEIYSILTLSEDQFTLKAFSREYCFAGVEMMRKNQILNRSMKG